MTVALVEVLREVQGWFAAASLQYGHGTDNAWDEAVALVLGVSGLPDTQSSLDAPIPQAQVSAMRNFARRRIAERQPLAYLLGKTPYCGALFQVPPGVMVPRSPIGPLLRGDGLRPWLHEPETILDLCCGTGCLGILAAGQFPNAHVVLADIDPLAVDVARRNIEEHKLTERVRAVRSDLFAALGHRTYDLILCNPPYVDADTMANLPPEFAHEPVLGLHGGDDGLTLMNRVLSQTAEYLTSDGILVGEVGEGRARLEAHWPQVPFIWPDLPDGGEGVFLLPAVDALH